MNYTLYHLAFGYVIFFRFTLFEQEDFFFKRKSRSSFQGGKYLNKKKSVVVTDK